MASVAPDRTAAGVAAVGGALLDGAPRRADRVWYAVALVLIVSGLVHLGVAAVSDRAWEGPLSFRKPATFGLSFGLTLATVVWVTRHLRMTATRRRLLLLVLAVDCVVEVTGITIQAWRDVPSHLNTTTPFDAAVAYSLAAGGAVLVATLGAFAVPALRGRTTGGADLVLALRWGFVFLLAGLAAGVAMIAYGTTVMRTGDSQRAYDVAGFLKGFHAVSLHAILVLPALAAVAARRGWDEARRARLVRWGATTYGLAGVAVLVTNLVTAFTG